MTCAQYLMIGVSLGVGMTITAEILVDRYFGCSSR